MDIVKNEQLALGYSGKVEIDFIKNGKSIKKIICNSGTPDLFLYICKCLAGQLNPMLVSSNIDLRPGGLKLYGDDTDGAPLTTHGIVASTCTVGKTDSAGYITYEFLVPGVAIVNKVIKSVRLTPINSNSDLVYAEATIENNNGITVSDSNTNLYLRWTLMVQNIG